MGCTDIHYNHLLRRGDGEVGCGGGIEIGMKEEKGDREKKRAKLEERRKKEKCLSYENKWPVFMR